MSSLDGRVEGNTLSISYLLFIFISATHCVQVALMAHTEIFLPPSEATSPSNFIQKGASKPGGAGCEHLREQSFQCLNSCVTGCLLCVT